MPTISHLLTVRVDGAGTLASMRAQNNALLQALIVRRQLCKNILCASRLRFFHHSGSCRPARRAGRQHRALRPRLPWKGRPGCWPPALAI
eukprot:6551792-Pyramimonas_sp.AAC.1